MGKKKDKKKEKRQAKAEALTPGGASAPAAAAEPKPKMSNKEFEQEMEKLQVELVRMQEWVKASGAKVCVLFEGRDTAGKGGVIKRITERVSPRVFRVVALSAPSEREKSQMYIQLNDEQKGRILTQIPAGRMGSAQEIAAAVLYLASPEAGYVTGATLHVNGGMAMI